jgi:hypothetical protein
VRPEGLGKLIKTIRLSGSRTRDFQLVSWLQTPRSRVRFPALSDFLSSSGSGRGVHSALVRINEELLERKVAVPV